MGKSSNFVQCINKAIEKGYLNECFTAKEVKEAFKKLCDDGDNECCNFAENTYSSFLSKHKEGNSGGYKTYFKKCKYKGYKLIKVL